MIFRINCGCEDAPCCGCCDEVVTGADALDHDDDLMADLYAAPDEVAVDDDDDDNDNDDDAPVYVAAETGREDWELYGSDWDDRLYPD